MFNIYSLKSDFLKSVLVIMSGTAAAQGIGFLLLPIISRLYSPDNFGLFGAFLSIVSIVGVSATFQYSQALMLPKKTSEAFNLLAVAITLTIIIALLSGVGILLFSQQLEGLINYHLDPVMIAMMPLAIFLLGFNSSIQAWCVRQKAFKRTSLSQVVRTLFAAGGQTICGIAGMGSLGLVTGSIFGDSMSGLNLSRVFSSKMMSRYLRLINLKEMFRLAKFHKHFAIYTNTQCVMNAIAFGIPVIFIARYYGVTTAGLYAFSVRVLQAPADLIIRALRQVLFQKYCEVNKVGGDLNRLFKRSTFGLVAIAIVPVCICIVWAPHLFSWLFGQSWLVAGQFSQWLIIGQFATFCNVPANLLGQVVGQQRPFFYFHFIQLILSFLVLFIGGEFFPVIITVAGLAMVNVALSGMLIVWIWYWLRKNAAVSTLCCKFDSA